MNATIASWLPTLALTPLVAFGLYRRYKRSFGRQALAPKRMMARMALLVIVCGVFVAWTPTASGLAAAAGGAVFGIALAWVGLAHTKLDVSAEGAFYTPNKWIGLGVMALFIGRLAARAIAVYRAAEDASPGASPLASLQRSPLTTGIIFLMATYYVGYYAGVLWKTRELATVGTG